MYPAHNTQSLFIAYKSKAPTFPHVTPASVYGRRGYIIGAILAYVVNGSHPQTSLR